MEEVPRRYTWAFLIGCVEPDKNPTTYFKGSIRCQLLRGHNWANAQRYMQRTSLRLEHREHLKLLDYYVLGKLIHYTTDAFTYAHNEAFHENLHSHRNYESKLKAYFPKYLEIHRERELPVGSSIMDAIRLYHSDYIHHPASIHTDSRYCVMVCSTVLALLFPRPATM